MNNDIRMYRFKVNDIQTMNVIYRYCLVKENQVIANFGMEIIDDNYAKCILVAHIKANGIKSICNWNMGKGCLDLKEFVLDGIDLKKAILNYKLEEIESDFTKEK